VEKLNAAVSSLRKGQDFALSFASAPSIAQFIAARAIRGARQRFSDHANDLGILKIEETHDNLLKERGEFVMMSSAIDNPAVASAPVARGRIVAILPEGHPIAAQAVVSVRDIVRHPLVGVDPDDPHGKILARPFREAGPEPRHGMRGRLAQTRASPVRQGPGVPVIDEFSAAEVCLRVLMRRQMREPVSITAHVVTRRGHEISRFAAHPFERFRRELTQAMARTGLDPPRL
jgi:hypothetical protein